MPATILLHDLRRAGRRRLLFFLRWLYAGLLLAQLGPWVLVGVGFELNRPGSSALAVYGSFFDTFTTQHFFYLFLLTPALAAAAVGDEKVRGTLDALLTTCLRPADIVLGFLLSRTAQVFSVVLVALPIVCFFGVMGDLNLDYAAALLAASAVLILALAALGILAGALCRQTRDAVVVAYLLLAGGTALVAAIAAAGWDGPAVALSPWDAVTRDRDERWPRLARFTLAWLVPLCLGIGLAIVRLRPVAAPAPRRARARHRVRAIADAEGPVTWRERCIQGIAPIARLRAIPARLAALLVALACAAALVVPVGLRLGPGTDLLAAFRQGGLPAVHMAVRLCGISGWDIALPQAGLALFVLTLLVAVRASSTITEERERGTWDALLLTPLTTPQIIRGKFYGLIAAAAPYLLAYAALSLPLALFIGPQALLVCAFMAGAMLVIVPGVAAVGLCCSAYLGGSVRSLLTTVAITYGYLLVVLPTLVIASTVGGCVRSISEVAFQAFAQDIDAVVPEADALAGCFSGAATLLWLNAVILGPAVWALLKAAEERIEKVERAHVTRKQRRRMRLERLADELATERAGRDRAARDAPASS